MKNKTLLTLGLLSALMLTAVSCGSATEAPSANTEAPTATTTEAETEAEENNPYAERLKVSANLPSDLDFGGASFRTIVNSSGANVMHKDFYMENADGDIVDDALFNRRVYVEELLNVKIEPSLVQSASDAQTTILKSVNAGEDAYDIYSEHMINAGSDTLKGLFLNWYDIPYMDFSQPWYPSATIDSLTVDGVMFLTLSDILISAVHNTYCIYYNKDIASDYDLPNLYQIVKDGKWTLDKMTELGKDIYVDLNGDGTRDAADRYGYSTSIDSDVVVYFWAFGVNMVEIQNGEVVLTGNTERTQSIVTKLRDFLYNSGCAYVTDVYTDFIQLFVNGNVLFIPRCIGETMTYFREMENYGILPMPKLDEAQSSYYTQLDGCSPVMAVPKTATQLDMIGAVMEAMGEYSYKYVYPAYFDTALKVKGTRDEESVEMLDIISASRLVDFQFVYDGFKGFSFSIQDLLKKTSTKDFASYYASKQKSVQKHYDSVYAVFKEAAES